MCTDIFHVFFFFFSRQVRGLCIDCAMITSFPVYSISVVTSHPTVTAVWPQILTELQNEPQRQHI